VIRIVKEERMISTKALDAFFKESKVRIIVWEERFPNTETVIDVTFVELEFRERRHNCDFPYCKVKGSIVRGRGAAHCRTSYLEPESVTEFEHIVIHYNAQCENKCIDIDTLLFNNYLSKRMFWKELFNGIFCVLKVDVCVHGSSVHCKQGAGGVPFLRDEFFYYIFRASNARHFSDDLF